MPKRFSGDIVCRKRNSSPAALAAFKNWFLWHNVTMWLLNTIVWHNLWHYCDTIETKAAVVIILLDGNANSPKKGKKHEPWFARGHLCAQITLSRGGVPRFPISIRARQMIGKTRGLSWEGLAASLRASSFVCYRVGNQVQHLYSRKIHQQQKTDACFKTQSGMQIQRVRLNTNLQGDYPKKLFVFMQFAPAYLASHLCFLAVLQNEFGIIILDQQIF